MTSHTKLTKSLLFIFLMSLLLMALSYAYLRSAPSVHQNLANFFDSNKSYQHTPQDIQRMSQQQTLCFKNSDCTFNCGEQINCNSRIFNRYYQSSALNSCTEIGCPRTDLFSYLVCQNQTCVKKPF